MSDEPVRTWVRARGALARLPGVHDPRAAPRARSRASSSAGSRPPRRRPRSLEAIAAARAIVIGPSNPVISIGPILAVPGMREALRAAAAPVVAVSPLVGGAVLKGPTAAFLAWAGPPLDADGIAAHYDGLLDGLVADERGGRRCRRCETDALMADADGARARVAREALALRARRSAQLTRTVADPARQALRRAPSSGSATRSATARAARWPRRWSATCSTRCAAPRARRRRRRHRASRAREALARRLRRATSSHDPRRGGPVAPPRRSASTRRVERGAERVLLVPGDCPALDPARGRRAARRAGPGRRSIVPDRHGTGTNALLLDPPDAIAPAFGPGCCARHAAAPRAAGVRVGGRVELPSLALDVDTPTTSRRCAPRSRAARRRRAHARACSPGLGRL